MKPGQINKLAKLELDERIVKRKTQIRAKIESITYRLNEYVQGGLEGIEEQEAKVLFDDLMGLMADYRQALKQRKELDG